MERLAARRLCIFNTNFLFLLRKSKVSCNSILKIPKKVFCIQIFPRLWDKPARTALGPFLRLWSTQPFSVLDSSMTSFVLVIWAYEQSGSALSTGGVLVLLSTDALCVWCVGAALGCLPIPLMNANLDVLFRTHIPVKMQGRVYAARNSPPF